MDDHSSKTTKVRLGNPICADLYTTERRVPVEKVAPATGATMASELGSSWNDSFIVNVTEVPDKGQKVLTFTHFRDVPIATQHERNWEITAGDVGVRTYVMRREKYNATDFPPVDVTTPDTKFPQYGFTHEAVLKGDWGLDTVYVVVQRFYQQIVKVRSFYDDDLDCNVTETTEIIEAGSGTASSTAGTMVEIQPVNTFYDLLITTQAAGTYPRELPSIPSDIPYKFPPLLKDITFFYVFASANSDSAADSYSEDYFFDYNLIEPTPGPYEARILRFLTGDPDAFRSEYPVQKFVTVRETVGIARAWYSAGPKGNSTFAEAKQIEIPPSIHGEIVIDEIETISVGENKNVLAETPGFSVMSNQAVMVVGYETFKVAYGLYEARITLLNCTGVYNGITVPFGTDGGNTGAGDVTIPSNAPKITTATVSANNTTVSGKATPNSMVNTRIGAVEYGRSTSDENGDFVITLTNDWPAPVTLSVRARKNGVNSAVFLVTTNDLAPAAPTATLSSSLLTVSGMTQPGAEVSIVVNSDPPVIVTADGSGAYTHTFGAPLTGGDVITVTASDAGGTSPPTVITASATPPTLSTAAFDGSNVIEGTASVGAKVVAFYGTADIGDDIADGSGNFSITLDRGYVRGEVIRVTAYDPGDDTIASASIFLTASELDLEVPSFTKTAFGYVGVAPVDPGDTGGDGFADIVWRPDPGDASDEVLATLHPNGNFVFNLPGGENGERYAIYARYTVGDSDPVYEVSPVVALNPAKVFLAIPDTTENGITFRTGIVEAGFPYPIIPTGAYGGGIRTVRRRMGSGLTTPFSTPSTHMLRIESPNIAPGTVVTLKFPGQATADIILDPGDAIEIAGGRGLTWMLAPIPAFAYTEFVMIPPYYWTNPLTGANFPTAAAVDALIPPLMVIHTLAPDGRETETLFDRAARKPYDVYDA